jgi:hypothetical protein
VRDQNELMLFVMVAGAVALAALWSLSGWRQGRRDADPAARLLAVLAVALLGGLVGLGRWSWIGERHGARFWVPFAAAAALIAADWIRAARARRRPAPPTQAPEDAGSGGGGSPAAVRARRP